MLKSLFSTIPYINEILASPKLKPFMERLHPASVLATVKGVFDDISGEMLSAASEWRRPDLPELIEKIVARLQLVSEKASRLVLDVRGELLGGHPISIANGALESMIWAVDEKTSISAQVVEERLCRLTGAEDAILFSAPLHARLAAIRTFASHRRILIARRDLYEDEQGVRLENLFHLFSASPLEVGASNRVREEDFLSACSAEVGLTYFAAGRHSDWKVPLSPEGFNRLKEKAEPFGFPILCEVELASLLDLSPYFSDPIPMLADYLNMGNDLVLCNGAQLIGGPSCGILLGKKQAIEEIRKSLLSSFLVPHRVDLSGLDKTLSWYQEPDAALQNIPILQTISISLENLSNRAERLLPQLAACSIVEDISSVEGESILYKTPKIGRMKTILLLVRGRNKTPEQLARILADTNPGLLVRTDPDKVSIDLRMIPPFYDSMLVDIFEACSEKNRETNRPETNTIQQEQ